MARTRKTQKKICSVTGLETSASNFYKNQNHLKAVDNFRRVTGVKKDQLQRMFNQINQYA
mgnify:CR=1 FL=1|jgi:hypothetical protein|tara:strand:+ start:385 stop:564 length:180 start_codon:yes stop_codon:yes gene_type:complete